MNAPAGFTAVSKNNNHLKVAEYSRIDAIKSLGSNWGWIIPEVLGTSATAINQLGLDHGLKGVIHTTNLATNMDIVSKGYDFVSLCTSSWIEVAEDIQKISTKPLKALETLFFFASTVSGSVRFFHQIGVIDLKKLDGRLAIFKFSVATIACALAVYNFSQQADLSEAGHWKVAGTVSLGGIFSLCLVSTLEISKSASIPYMMTGLSLATCVAFTVFHFKDHYASHQKKEKGLKGKTIVA